MKPGTKLKRHYTENFVPCLYDEKYVKAKVREYNSVIKTNFWGDKIPKEHLHHTCKACISIDYVMRIEKKLSTRLFQRMQV